MNSTNEQNKNKNKTSEDNIVAFTFEIPTDTPATEAKSELDNMYSLNADTHTQEFSTEPSTTLNSSSEESTANKDKDKDTLNDEKRKIYKMSELLRPKFNNNNNNNYNNYYYYEHEQGAHFIPNGYN